MLPQYAVKKSYVNSLLTLKLKPQSIETDCLTSVDALAVQSSLKVMCTEDRAQKYF